MDWAEQKVAQLKQALREKGLETGGLKAALAARLVAAESAAAGDAFFDLTGGQRLRLRTIGLKLVGEAGGEQREIRPDEPSSFAVQVHREGIEIENIQVSNHAADVDCAVGVDEGGSVEVKGCDLRGRVFVVDGGTLLLKDSRVHHCTDAGVFVLGIADIQDSIVEDGRAQGIFVQRTGNSTISGTKIRRNVMYGMIVNGEATIKNSSVTANGKSGVLAWRTTRSARPAAPS